MGVHFIKYPRANHTKRIGEMAALCTENKEKKCICTQANYPRYPHVNAKLPNLPDVLTYISSNNLWLGAFLLVRPHLLPPANELCIAVQAIGDEIHDV